MTDPQLLGLPVLAVDCQTTGATPGRDHLLEVAWCAVTGPAGPLMPHSFLVRLPDGVVIPDRISRMTGIASTGASSALDAGEVWRLLEAAAAGRLPVAHFAGFEQRWLDFLFAEQGGGASRFPRIVCTREIARRLLPGLPGKGLRAVAGYLGHDMGERRRAGDHVVATVIVWRALRAELSARGTETLEDLLSLLAEPVPCRGGAPVYSLPREQRLALPDRPGVYRFLSGGGRVLYAGKATSLRRRVNSYFTRRTGCPRTMELVTRACSVEAYPAETAVEAALEEARVIRELDPPYNVALRDRGRGLRHLSRDLSEASRSIDPLHPVGPVSEGSPVLLLHDLLGMLTGVREPDPGVLGLGGIPMAPGAFEAGLVLFREDHAGASVSIGRLLSLGRVLRIRRAGEEKEAPCETEPGEPPGEVPESPSLREDMEPSGVLACLQGLLEAGAREVRLAAALRLLGWSVARWRSASGAGVRWIRMDGGAILGAGWMHADPVIAPLDRAPADPRERQRLLTTAACGLLRVFLSELRRVSAAGRLEGLDLAATGASLDAARASRLLEAL